MIENNVSSRVSLATIYNTVHTFREKGYLKEIAINSSESYFDTNTSQHHHFFDVNENKLIDLEDQEVEPIQIKKTIPGKKIKSVEILVKIDSDN